MTLRLTTKLRNELLERETQFPTLNKVQVDTAGNTSFTPAASTAGSYATISNTSINIGSIFAAGDTLNVYGTSASSAANDGVYAIVGTSSTSTVEVQESVVNASAQTCVMAVLHGGSFRELFKNGVMDIFTGTQPSNPDNAVSNASVLCTITRGSGTFSASVAENGLNFDPVSGGTLTKKGSETWSGLNNKDGTAGWFRFYDNTYSTGSGASAVRMDGNISTSGAELNMSSTSLTSGATTTIDSFAMTLPSS